MPDEFLCPYNNAVRNERDELVPCGTDGDLCGDCANDAFEQYQTNIQEKN